MDNNACLALTEYGAAFGDKIILVDLEFTIAPLNTTVLMGPTGSGKSTLLRALAGQFAGHPRFRSWGSAHFLGKPVGDGHYLPIVQQNARVLSGTVMDALIAQVRESLGLSPLALRDWCVALVRRMGFPDLERRLDTPVLELLPVEARAVAILREAACEPALLLVDEPTAELEDYDAFIIIELLREVAKTSALLVVMHHQKQAQQLGHSVVLLAGGHVQEARAMDDFFSAPLTEAGAQFVRSGSCAIASPDADPATLAEGVTPPAPLPAHAHASLGMVPVDGVAAPMTSGGPVGFQWLVPGKLAGTPMPGVVNDVDHDLRLLARLGVTMLITLTERDLDPAPLARHGLRNLHLPTYDREAPSMGQIQMLLKRMETLIASGNVLAVHCLGGVGRTGTVLAAWLIREGLTAQEALRRVRLLDHRYVQSEDQEAFLVRYEDVILQKIV